MSILIKSKYTESEDDIKIDTFRGDEPHFPEEIDSVNGIRLSTTNMTYEDIYVLRNKLFDAFCKQKEDENKYNALHYNIEVDILFAKKFLYENCIENYGIIDHLTNAVIYDNNINVKYKINDKEYEYTFEGYGYDLMRIIKLRELDGVD